MNAHLTTIKLNHLNLPVANVAETAAFFQQYFGFTCTEVKGDYALAVLTGQDGFVLVLMQVAFNSGARSEFPDAFHLGFLVDEKEQVDAIFSKLSQDGITSNGPKKIHGGYGFYFKAPGNILTEVTWYN